MKVKEIISFFKRYFITEKKMFNIAMFFVVTSSIVSIFYGYFVGIAVDKVSQGYYAVGVVILILYMILGIVDRIFLHRNGDILINKICSNMMEKITYDVYYKVGLLPARAFEEKSSGEMINRITQDSSNITGTFKQLIRTLMSLFSVLLVFIYIIINSWIIALEIVIYLLVFAYITNRFLPIIKKKQEEIQKERDNIVAGINESIRGIREIRALGIRKKMNVSIKKVITIIFDKSKQQMVDEKDYYSIVWCLNDILEALVFITCIILMFFKITSLAFFISLTYYIYRFMGTVDNVVNLSTEYQKMRVSIERISEVIDNKLYEDEKFGNVHKTKIDGNIEFKNVTFRYNNEEKNIFNNLNLKVDANKQIAIVGKSGQGKTSIFNLMLRYFEPDEGVILIDDIPLKDFDEESLRKNVAIIRQEPFIFNKTILENFKILDDKLSLKKIKEACKMAEIDDYIMSLPNKYETIIGEGGVNLSGGQKQRLAIARALLKESKIILFDEATSALDNDNQNKIKKVIKKLSKDHTIVVVAHRLSTIIDADNIIVLDKGKIVATGTHNDLISKNKIYKSLYKSENL